MEQERRCNQCFDSQSAEEEYAELTHEADADSGYSERH